MKEIKQLKTKIFQVTFLTIVLSIVVAILVLTFQKSELGSNVWDFEGASGFATIVPAFTGIILAAWAIYTQAHANSPATKIAENYRIKIMLIQHKLLRIISLCDIIDSNERKIESENIDDIEEMNETTCDLQSGESNIAYGQTCYGVLSSISKEFDEEKIGSLAQLFIEVSPIIIGATLKITKEAKIENIEKNILEIEISMRTISHELAEALETRGITRKIVETVLKIDCTIQSCKHVFDNENTLAEILMSNVSLNQIGQSIKEAFEIEDAIKQKVIERARSIISSTTSHSRP